MADEMNPDQPQPQQGLSQAYLDSVMARKQEAERQMQKLMDALNVRKNMPFDPVGMRIAGALLAPTKTGSFGESAGYAATAAADETEKQAMRGIDFAKLEFELGQKKLEQQKGMDALKLRQQFFGGKPAAAAPVAAQPLTDVPQASTPEAPAMSPEAMLPVAPPSMVSAAPPAAPAGYQRQMPTGMDALLMMESDPELYKLLSEEDKRRLEDAKFGLEQRKTEATERVTVESGGVKISMPLVDYNRMTGAIEKGDFDTAKKYYTKHGLDFPFVKDDKGWRRKTASESAREIEVAKGIEAKVYPTRFGPISMLPADYFKFRTIDEADPKAGEEFLRRIVAGEATSPAGEKPKLITEDQRKYQESKQTEVMKEDVKASAEQAALVQKRATDAFELKEAIDDLDSRAKSNPKIFGLMQGPGYAKAIARAVDDGTNMVKLGKIAEGKLSREDLLALQDAANAEAKVRNLMRKAARIPGEGATSDLETRMQVALALTTSMSPEIVRIRAEVMRERINFDEKVFELWSKYKKSEKGYFQEFLTESKEYKDLKKNYENKLKTIRDANSEFFSRSARASSAASRSGAPRSNAPSGGNVQRFFD